MMHIINDQWLLIIVNQLYFIFTKKAKINLKWFHRLKNTMRKHIAASSSIWMITVEYQVWNCYLEFCNKWASKLQLKKFISCGKLTRNSSYNIWWDGLSDINVSRLRNYVACLECLNEVCWKELSKKRVTFSISSTKFLI